MMSVFCSAVIYSSNVSTYFNEIYMWGDFDDVRFEGFDIEKEHFLKIGCNDFDKIVLVLPLSTQKKSIGLCKDVGSKFKKKYLTTVFSIF